MRCGDCGAVVDLSEGVCTNCGLVFEKRPIHYGFDFEDGDSEEKPKTVISWDDPDIGIKTYHSNKTKNEELKKAFKTEKRTQPNLVFGRWQSQSGEGYLNAYNEIQRLCSTMKLSNTIRDNAIWILRKLTVREFIQKSYKKYASYAAIVMLSARFLSRLPIRFTKIVNYTDEDIKKIKKAYSELKKELGIASNPFYLFEIVEYQCNELGLSFDDTRKCIEFAKKVKPVGGRNLYGYSAAIIRIKTNMTRRDISNLLDVSEPTITARERELRKYG